MAAQKSAVKVLTLTPFIRYVSFKHVISNVFVTALLVLSMSRAVYAVDEPKEEVVAAPYFSTCFENSEQFGRLPKPDCKVRLRPKWADDAELFQFNKLGLRDKDYSAKPDKDTVRILLLGPMFDGFGLSDSEMANRKLADRLQLMGVKKVEVINGSVSGFFAPRTAEFALKLLDAYDPDLIIYFQTGDSANPDLVESKAMKFSGDMLESFHGAPGKMSGLKSYLSYLADLWSLHRQARSSQEEAEDFLAPSLESFRKLLKHLRPDQRFIVFYSQRPATMSLNFAEGSGYLASLLNHFVPKLQVPPALIKSYLRETGVHAYPTARGFRTPVQNELVYEQDPVSLTAQGANAFAWTAAPWIRAEIVAMNKVKVEKTKTPTEPRRRRARRRRRRGQNQ